MIPLPPKIKLVLGAVLAAVLAGGEYWKDKLPWVPGWLPPLLSVLTFVEGYLTLPGGVLKDIAGKAGAVAFVLVMASTQVACVPVTNFPTLDKVEKIVLLDLASCDTSTSAGTAACVQQMESDVAKAYAGQVGVDSVKLVNDALTILSDAGIIPKDLLPKARLVRGTLRLRLATAPDAGE